MELFFQVFYLFISSPLSSSPSKIRNSAAINPLCRSASESQRIKGEDVLYRSLRKRSAFPERCQILRYLICATFSPLYRDEIGIMTRAAVSLSLSYRAEVIDRKCGHEGGGEEGRGVAKVEGRMRVGKEEEVGA